MTRSRGGLARLVAGVVTVLAVAVAGVVLRGALQDGAALRGGALPAHRTAAASHFSLGDAVSRSAPRGAELIAAARRSSVRVYAAPRAGRARRLGERVFDGQRIPLVFSVLSHRPGWVHVQLPTRPNHASGWVRRHDVRFSYTQLRVRVDLRRRQLLVTRGHRPVLRASIGVGRAVSPTPRGRYYLTDVVRPPDPKGFYGPYALGLSAHSPVYTTFEGGDGQVGIHGTNAPAVIGHDVSHGCIRVRNTVIRRLARLLPLGAPVTIER
jgi:hypothetical protein